MEQLKQHDESIAAAEEQERDLRRQILEVQESKPEGRDTPEIETDSVSVLIFNLGINILKSKLCMCTLFVLKS